MRKVQLYEAGVGGYYTYRIASLVATKQGSLLAFCADHNRFHNRRIDELVGFPIN